MVSQSDTAGKLDNMKAAGKVMLPHVRSMETNKKQHFCPEDVNS